MRANSRLFATVALSAGLCLAAASAHAVTIVPISTGPFGPGNTAGVIPANITTNGNKTTDFTFTTLFKTYTTLMQLQASSISSGDPEPVAFKLYSGTPGTSSFIANSGGTSTAATLLWSLAPGSYFLQYKASAAPKELITGGITLLSGTPEPAAWTMLLIGLGGLGATLRARRRTTPAI
jgi:hypothetical protein